MLDHVAAAAAMHLRGGITCLATDMNSRMIYMLDHVVAAAAMHLRSLSRRCRARLFTLAARLRLP